MSDHRDVKPKRKIPIGQRSLTGSLRVKDDMVAFESSLERDMLIILDADRSFVRVVEQPFRIPYRSQSGTQLTYTPDFLATRRFERGLLIEVKYRQELRDRWPELRARFRAAVSFANDNDLRFRIFDETRIRTPIVDNLKFLRRFECPIEDQDPVAEHMVSTLERIGEASARDLLAEAYRTDEGRMRAIPKLWGMVRASRIRANLYFPLTMATLLKVAPGGGTVWPGPHSYRHPLAEAHLRRIGLIPPPVKLDTALVEECTPVPD